MTSNNESAEQAQKDERPDLERLIARYGDACHAKGMADHDGRLSLIDAAREAQDKARDAMHAALRLRSSTTGGR